MNVRGAAGNFDTGATVRVFLLRLRVGATPVALGTGTATNDGSADVRVTIPSNTEPGVYIVYLESTANNFPRVLVAPIVVVPAGRAQASWNGAGPGIGGADTGSGTGGGGRALGVVGAAGAGAAGAGTASFLDVPEYLQPLMALSDAQEAAAIEAVLGGGKPFLRPDGLVDVRRVGLAGPDEAASAPPAPFVAAAGLLAGWGVLRLRRREPRRVTALPA